MSGTETDLTVLKIRNPDRERVLVDGSEADDDGEPTPISRELVASAARADDLLVAEGVADADRDRVQSFLDETDFDAEAVYVAPVGVESCDRLDIHSVSWRPGRVEYEYCRELRPPEEACEADARVTLALVFRLPVALDGRLSGYRAKVVGFGAKAVGSGAKATAGGDRRERERGRSVSEAS